MSEDFGTKYEGQDEFRAQQEARLTLGVREDLGAFRDETDGKMELGDQKYGTDSWQRHDQLAEAMSELVDLANYAFLKWRQLRALQAQLDAMGMPRSLTREDRVGPPPVTIHSSRLLEFEDVGPADDEPAFTVKDDHQHFADPYSTCYHCRFQALEAERRRQVDAP